MSFRETILNEALILFEQKGIQNTSTEALLEALDISRGTLHEIATSRKDLVQRCIAHSLHVRQAVAESVVEEAENPMEALLQLLQFSVEEVYSFSPVFVQDLRDFYPRSWSRLELFMRQLAQDYMLPLLTQCMKEGYLQQDLRPEIVVRVLLNLLQGLLNPQLFPSLAFEYQELFKGVIVYYLRGCATTTGQALLEEYSYKPMAV
ncbi:TetR/AcrR family transcriptional regulator [Sabulibacter ruber]|uniref:TetR/AcrR family transcriptional regulator n=1 Tax=Sabulibacter ruber TaxID=2811901 RepID=UPI001A978B4F|nr:TetR/AcrR family transcriptional regulator [Sabulibacter ruber]